MCVCVCGSGGGGGAGGGGGGGITVQAFKSSPYFRPESRTNFSIHFSRPNENMQIHNQGPVVRRVDNFIQRIKLVRS